MIRWIAFLLLLPVGALAQTTENSSKLNTYVLLAPGPENSALASKVVTYVVLDASTTFIGSTKLNGYAVLDGATSIIGAAKLNTYIVLAPRVPGGGFYQTMP